MYISSYSHITYHNLTSEEKDARLRNILHSLAVMKQRLNSKVAHMIDDQGIYLEESDVSDTLSLISEVSPIVESRFPSHTPQKVFKS